MSTLNVHIFVRKEKTWRLFLSFSKKSQIFGVVIPQILPLYVMNGNITRFFL